MNINMYTDMYLYVSVSEFVVTLADSCSQ
jgi:hypothetical protein